MSMKVTKEQFIGMTYDELLAENEKLWALNEHMGLKDMAVIGGLEKENERLKADNAKLRELVRELWAQAEQNLVCDENCPYGAICNWMDSDVVCVFKRRMRELGVDE